MSDKKNAKVWALALVAAAIVAVVAALCLYFRQNEPGEGAQAPSRLEDPVYLAQLEEVRQEQKVIQNDVVRAQSALDAAEAAQAGEEELAKLREARDLAVKNFTDNRKKAREIVRARILQEVENDNLKTKGK